MRYAIVSDVHGNFEALSAVLADADAEGAEAILGLGDLVGYGADPGPCVDLLADRGATLVAGNHEWGAAGLIDVTWFNPAARAAILWTRDHLAPDASAYLGALPLVTTVGDAHLVHASPRNPDEWEYLTSAEDGFSVFGAFPTRLCFIGHSHRPGVWSLGSAGPDHGDAFRAWPLRIGLEDGRRYVINVGSVGQPRDRDARAAYALWDLDRREVTIRRVGYDHHAAAEKILAAGLPRVLADRLARGF